MTNQTIPPALTAQEWAHPPAFDDDSGARVGVYDGQLVVTDNQTGYGLVIDPDKTMALANHALPDGHPLKITRADVVAARRISHDSGGWTDENRDIVERLAAKLAALLPPEDA